MKSITPPAPGSTKTAAVAPGWRVRGLRVLLSLGTTVWQCALIVFAVLLVVLPVVWTYRRAFPANDTAGMPEMKRAGMHQERAFSLESGPEVVGALDRARVVVLKHRETGRRFAVVMTGEALAMEEIR